MNYLFLKKINLREEEILNEQNYNWKKHFLFTLPDMFSFVLKAIILWFLMYVFIGAMATVLLQELPNFCSILK